MNTNKKILIVDDDAGQRKSLQDILKAKGYKPIAIARGKTALEKAKKEKPAVALIDLKLPDMSGLKVMKGIKKYSPATECIVLTGHATKESAIEAINLGAFNYLLKPYDMDQLLLSIHRALQKLEAEETIKKSEEKFRKIIDNANIMIIGADGKGRVKLFNKEAERVLGYSQQEVLNKNLIMLHPPEERAEVKKKFAKHKRGEPHSNLELGFYTKDGKRLDGSLARATFKDDSGEDFFVGLVQDITERKQVEDALRDSSKELLIRNRIADIFLTVTGDEMFAEVLQVVLDAMDSKYGIFAYIDENGNAVCPSMTRDVWDKCQVPQKSIVFPPETWAGIWGRALKEKKTLYSNKPFKVPQGHIRISRILCVPILHQEKLLGYFRVANKETDYTEKDRILLEAIADHIAPVLQAKLEKDRYEKERQQAVEALKESEKWFRALFEQAGDAAFLVDPKGKFEDVNQRACDALGYSKEELLEKTVSDIDPVYPKKRFTAFFQNLETDIPVTVEAVHRRQDGVVFPVEIRTVLINVRGKPHLLSLARDITMRKKVEEALIISEERFRLIFQNSPIGIATSDSSHRFIKVNKAFCDMLGYTEQELTKLTVQEITHPDDRKDSKSLSNSLLKGKTSGYSMEKRYLKKDGQFFWGSLTTSIARDGTGKPLYAIGMVEDITERKQAEENVKVLAKFPSENPNPVLRINNDGAIQFANKASQPVLDELIRKTEHFSSHEWKRMIRDIHISRETSDLNLTINNRIYSLTFTPIAEADYLYVYGLDITKRKQAEGKLRISYKKLRNLSAHLQKVREEERTSIAREIHDELGQLLTALQMDLSNLTDELPQNDKSLIKKTKSLAKLIDLSIQTTQKISSDLRPSILDNLGVIPAIKRHAKEFQSYSKIKCALNFEHDDIVMDKDFSTVIFRIFQETLTNVSRHAKATSIRTSMKKENGHLILKIKDNGRGITEEEIADPKSLGIIGIRERAHAVGGQVKIDGVKNKGTTVTVTLPISKKEKSQ